VVFLYTAPIFTALGLRFLPDERLDGMQWVGIAAAFLGIVVAFLGPGHRPVIELMVGDLLALLAGAATAKTILYEVGLAGPLLYALAIATEQARVVVSVPALLALLFQTPIIAIASYLAWFWLLRRYLTSRLMLLTLLTPLFGVVSGALILGDLIDPRFAAGALLVLAGILVVNGQLIRQRPE